MTTTAGRTSCYCLLLLTHLQRKVPTAPQLRKPGQVLQRQRRPAAAAAAGGCASGPADCDLELAQLWGQVLQLGGIEGQVPQQQAGPGEGCEGAGGWQQQVGAGTQDSQVLQACDKGAEGRGGEGSAPAPCRDTVCIAVALCGQGLEA